MPVQAQEQPSLAVSTELAGIQEIPLKAIQDSDGDIDTQNDFEIEPQNIVTLAKNADFHVLPDQGSVFAIKITDEQRETTDMQFSQSDGRVKQTLASKAYLLDIIVEMDNGDKYLYETVLAILEPGQTLNQVNSQNIIQNFVSSTSNSDTRIIFRDGDDNDDNEPPDDEPSICYFEPNDAPECEPDEEGNCPNDWPMNEQGNCHPGGECPDDYSRVDDDESGTCYPDDDITICEGSGALVLDPDDCDIYELPLQEQPETLAPDDNDTSSEPEEQEACEEGFVLENGVCAALDSNCGGVPCTASDKENSTTSNPIPGEPHTPTTDREEEETEEPEEEEEEPEQQEQDEAEDEEEN